jgi:hypothetical protein
MVRTVLGNQQGGSSLRLVANAFPGVEPATVVTVDSTACRVVSSALVVLRPP